MEKKKMALCTRIPEKELNRIREYCEITEAGELLHGKGNSTEQTLLEECMGKELVVLGDEPAGAETLKAWAASGMKFIGVAKGTPVTVSFDALRELQIPLSYTPGRNAVAVAEYTIGMMIAVTRHIGISSAGLLRGEHLGAPVRDVYQVPDVRNVIWGPLDANHPFTDYGIGFELYGKTLGIAGFGAIGKQVASRAKAFGMEVLAYDLYCPETAMTEAGVCPASLDEMLKNSDIVSIHLPVLDSTKAIVDKTWFEKMKPGAYLINTARAAVIHQRDLVEALEKGTIRGAAIDVFWQEPLPANHPLLKMRNVLLTPHMAGLTTDVDNWSGTIMAQDVLAYLEGRPRTHLWKL